MSPLIYTSTRVLEFGSTEGSGRSTRATQSQAELSLLWNFLHPSWHLQCAEWSWRVTVQSEEE